MSYTLYSDRNETFQCEVSVKNASLKGSIARLVVESTDGINLVFNGKIENGKCVVPVRRLRGLLDENSRGKIHLEMIIEDTYFKPWESDFKVEEHTSVKIKLAESKITDKPIIKVNVSSENATDIQVLMKEILNICNKVGLNKTNIKQRKNDFRQLIKEYFNANPEFSSNKIIILNGLKHSLK